MGAKSRRKGQVGEREVSTILCDWLGKDVVRNYAEQSAHGGVDLLGIDGWAIEVKRAGKDERNAWWKQTIEQAEAKGEKPVLIFRIDGFGRGLPPHLKWQAVVLLKDIGVPINDNHTGMITLQAWMDIIREQL